MPQEQTAQQFTPQEFAAKVKAKYPVYASIPDDQLVEKVTAKYPQYKTSIKFSPESQRPDAVKQAQAVIKNAPMTPSYSAMAVGHVPTGADPHNPGNPNLNALPPETRQAISSSLAKTQAGVLAGQGLGAGIEAGASKLLAPTVTSETVGTGILGPTGEEIMREGLKYGPSKVAKALSNPMAKEILKWVGKGIGLTAAWKAIDALGVMKGKGPVVP
jgi:hypothetical protein